MGKCDVCGKEAETQVVCSTCGAISFAYCPECLNQGREPYDALVGMGIFSNDMNKNYKTQILLPSLAFYGKTIEEFDADVQKMDDDYDEWVKTQQND
jgi:hypothetical protein